MIKTLIRTVPIMLMLVSLAKTITIENDASKLVIDGHLSIYASSGKKISDIGKTYTEENDVSRINFGFSHKESDVLTSVAYISIAIDPLAEYNSNSQLLGKYKSYVGLEHKVWGNLYLGTLASPNYQVIGWSDIGIGSSGLAHSQWANGDRGQKMGTGYAEDAIFYGKNFAFGNNQSIDFYAQVQAAEKSFSQDDYDGGLRRKDSQSLGLAYNLGKFSIGIAGVTGNYETKKGSLTTINEVSAGLRWKGEKLYLAGTTSLSNNIETLDIEKAGLELAADYKINQEYGLVVLYTLRKITGGDAVTDTKDMNELNYINLQGYRNISSNLKVYVMFTIDLRNEKEKNIFVVNDVENIENTNDNNISVGFKYFF